MINILKQKNYKEDKINTLIKSIDERTVKNIPENDKNMQNIKDMLIKTKFNG